MNCAKCGLELPANTRQCPKCGSINEFEQAPVAAKKKNPLMYVIIGLGVVGLLALAIYAMSNKNVASAPGGVERNDTNIATAPPGSPAPSGIVTAPPGRALPEKTPPGVTKPKPPQEVLDYLAYVKKVEEHRQMLLDDNSEAVSIAVQGVTGLSLGALEKDQDPWAKVTNELDRQASNWQATVKYFDQKPAPAECREFGGAYRAVIASQAESTAKLATDLGGVDFSNTKDKTQVFGALSKMVGTVQAPINKSIDGADEKLDNLVARYDMKKPFEIRREKQGGSLLGF